MSVAGAVLATCIASAAAAYQLPEPILWSIQKVEGGAPGAVSRNSNGTEDLGPMQINTLWVRELAAAYRQPPDVIRQRLIADTCFNVKVGAWILASEIARSGDFWTGVGHYHSRTPKHKARYTRKVVEVARTLFGPQVFSKR